MSIGGAFEEGTPPQGNIKSDDHVAHFKRGKEQETCPGSCDGDPARWWVAPLMTTQAALSQVLGQYGNLEMEVGSRVKGRDLGKLSRLAGPGIPTCPFQGLLWLLF